MVLVYGVFFGIHTALLSQAEDLRSAKSTQGAVELSGQLTAYQDEIRAANAQVTRVEGMEQQHIYWSVLLDKLESIAGGNIEFGSIGSKDYRVSLAGTAINRDELMAFRDRLSTDACFGDVNLPPANLFVQEKVDFQLDVVFKKECLKGRNL